MQSLKRFYLISFLIVAAFAIFGCGTDDGMRGMGDAATKTTGGDAGGRAGSIESDIVGGYMPGDIEAWKVAAQRNTTASKAGDVYTAVSITAGSGANALREAIGSDPVLSLIREEIEALRVSTAESRPTERLDALRAEMAARIKEIETASARATAGITIGDVHQELKVDSVVGKDPPVTTPQDAKIVNGIEDTIRAAKEKERAAKEPTTQPAQ